MIPDPLHPALIHFPIALAVLLPVAAVAAWYAIRRGSKRLPTWSIVVAISAVLFAGSFVTARTGQAQEDVVEKVLASEQPLHGHEEAAERFLIVAGIAFGLSALGLLGGRVGRVSRATMIAASLVAAGAIYPVGKSGGELVYEHGAAQAYTVEAAVEVRSANDVSAAAVERHTSGTDSRTGSRD